MIVISERINGLFKAIGKAIDEKDEKFIRDFAINQENIGANVLDINTGPGVDDPEGVMAWLVETVQEVTDVQLSIDTPNLKAMEAGLMACKNKAMINSATGETKKMEALFPLARDYNADIICLTMTEAGIPRDANERGEIALTMLATAMEYEITPDRMYFDPLVLPVSAAQLQGVEVLKALDMFKKLTEPAPKTVVGLSNISNNCKNRKLLNRTYMIMLMAYGLDAAIMDPFDEKLMQAIKTSDILLNKKLYADAFLKG